MKIIPVINIRFRYAVPSDVPLLRNFESKLVAHERSVEPTLIQKGSLEYYKIPDLIGDENASILIAEVDGVPIGCGLGQIKENDFYNNEKQYGYIGLMYVEESQRGKNIGGLIIQELMDWFGTKGINEIRLKVYASNPMAVEAYKKYGFEHYVHDMKLKKDTI